MSQLIQDKSVMVSATAIDKTTTMLGSRTFGDHCRSWKCQDLWDMSPQRKDLEQVTKADSKLVEEDQERLRTIWGNHQMT